MKKSFWIALFIIVEVLIFLWIVIEPPLEHIEDTNGPDDHSLEIITSMDVVDFEMGERGSIDTSETSWDIEGFDFSTGIEYSSSKFSGLHLLYSSTVTQGSDVQLILSDFKVESGNLAFFVLLNGEIVGEASPDELGTVDFFIENIDETGILEYVIAGESACFSFVAPSDWYE